MGLGDDQVRVRAGLAVAALGDRRDGLLGGETVSFDEAADQEERGAGGGLPGRHGVEFPSVSAGGWVASARRARPSAKAAPIRWRGTRAL